MYPSPYRPGISRRCGPPSTPGRRSSSTSAGYRLRGGSTRTIRPPGQFSVGFSCRPREEIEKGSGTPRTPPPPSACALSKYRSALPDPQRGESEPRRSRTLSGLATRGPLTAGEVPGRTRREKMPGISRRPPPGRLAATGGGSPPPRNCNTVNLPRVPEQEQEGPHSGTGGEPAVGSRPGKPIISLLSSCRSIPARCLPPTP
jgi:hypothetical protein